MMGGVSALPAADVKRMLELHSLIIAHQFHVKAPKSFGVGMTL
jgi:hypothetical protein